MTEVIFKTLYYTGFLIKKNAKQLAKEFFVSIMRHVLLCGPNIFHTALNRAIY